MTHEHEFHWYPEINEAGWKCCGCDFKPGEPPGFSPDLDRSETYRKCWAIASDLHDANIIHISNGTHGDCLAEGVAHECQETGLFDQYSIALFIVRGMQEGHAEFWRKISEGVLAGKDPRARCPCGALATAYRCGGGATSTARCARHSPEDFGGVADLKAATPELPGLEGADA